MQRLTIISGLKQEGKTRELFDSYKKHFTNRTINEDGSNRLLIRPVFITATKGNVFSNYISNLNTLELSDTDRCFITESHIFYNEVVDKDELFNIMATNLIEDNCVFYLDGMDNVISSFDDLLNFMDDFPGSLSNNSCDIIATNTRHIR